MAYLTIGEARDAFQRKGFAKSARGVLNEAGAAFRSGKRYDIFLSHCLKDAEIIAGVKVLLEESDLTVYVDWIEDKDLDRGNVTPQTAAVLRERMQASDSMIFATSEASPSSKWMPWELGYFDGIRQARIAILPLVGSSTDAFKGQEYIGLYPTVERLPHQGVAPAFTSLDLSISTWA
jgi:hypothetical protein